MNDDDRQNAALRCLKAGYSLDPVRPYSGGQFQSAVRAAIIDRRRRESSDRRRNEARERLACTERYAPRCDDPARNAELRDDKNRLFAAIAKLQPRQCGIIRDCYLQGTGAPEYAAEVGETTSTIRSLLHRAIEALREQLVGRK